MPLTDEQKDRARELKRNLGMSNRAIAESLGVSKDSINRLFKGGEKKGRKCAKKPPAHAHATEGGAEVAQGGATESAPQGAPPADFDDDDDLESPDREAMASMAYSDARTMRKVSLEGLERAKGVTDEKDRTWMESVYLKSLKESTRMLGAWGGLDEISDRDNPALEQYAEAMKEMAKTEAPDDWETVA